MQQLVTSLSLFVSLSRSQRASHMHVCLSVCLSARRAARPIDIITRKVTQVVATVFDSNWGVNYATHKMKLKRVAAATAPVPASNLLPVS